MHTDRPASAHDQMYGDPWVYELALLAQVAVLLLVILPYYVDLPLAPLAVIAIGGGLGTGLAFHAWRKAATSRRRDVGDPGPAPLSR